MAVYEVDADEKAKSESLTEHEPECNHLLGTTPIFYMKL